MMLTTKSKYAVMAILDIASQVKEKPTNLADIALRQNISISYLEQIFCKLRKKNIVNAIKGPGGGYILVRDTREISIAEVIEAVEEDIKITRCQGLGNCNKTGVRCLAHDLWEGLSDSIKNYLYGITIADVILGKSHHFLNKKDDTKPQVKFGLEFKGEDAQAADRVREHSRDPQNSSGHQKNGTWYEVYEDILR